MHFQSDLYIVFHCSAQNKDFGYWWCIPQQKDLTGKWKIKSFELNLQLHLHFYFEVLTKSLQLQRKIWIWDCESAAGLWGYSAGSVWKPLAQC